MKLRYHNDGEATFFYLGKDGFWIAFEIFGYDFEFHIAKVPKFKE